MPKNIKEIFNTQGKHIYDAPYYPLYPDNYYHKSCPVNVDNDTLPYWWPRQETVMGPQSLKHLSTGIPNYYPPQTIQKPIGTMYDVDLSKWNSIGGRVSYGFKAYPFHTYEPREIRYYSPDFLPTPDIFKYTKYKTVENEFCS